MVLQRSFQLRSIIAEQSRRNTNSFLNFCITSSVQITNIKNYYLQHCYNINKQHNAHRELIKRHHWSVEAYQRRVLGHKLVMSPLAVACNNSTGRQGSFCTLPLSFTVHKVIPQSWRKIIWRVTYLSYANTFPLHFYRFHNRRKQYELIGWFMGSSLLIGCFLCRNQSCTRDIQ